MADIALSVAGWVASPIISRLLKEGFSYLGDSDIEHRLENLETTILPQFQLVIEAAERSNEQHKSKLKQWLRKLKDAMYEAEDTLDLYKYQLLEMKVNDLNSASTSRSLGKFVGKLKKGVSSTFPSQNKKLRDSLIKLEKIAAEAKSFCELFLGVTSGSSMTNNTTIGGREGITTSFPLSKVFGRDDERDQIINKYLLDPSEACECEASPVQRRSYSVVVVVGIGGAGKTTLAQHVYNDQRVVDNFGIKMWICISRKLDVVKLTKEMIQSASKDDGCPHHENLDVLQRKLKDLIGSKKILLVLDDIWCYKSENEAEWEKLLAPLSFAKEGSKILVTTRPENRGNMPIVLHSKNIMELKDLGENELISLFMHYAFRGTKLSDTHLQDELTKIGKQILQKLNKSPLAVKAVGCQLSKRLEINFWKATLEQDNLTDARKALKWSYQRLAAPLQRCFSYFSLFRKGYSFEAEEMVHLWIAEGFISTSNDTRRMEDIGNDYCDELVSGSFLQLKAGSTKYYNMHDLFHDLAERVSEEDCFRMEDDQVKEIPSSIRHLGIWSKTMGKCSVGFHKLENLRTLLLFNWKGINGRDLRLSNNDRDLLIAAIEKFEKLRVLRLSSSTIKSLPKYIGDLKHLRYLNISRTYVAELPLSLGKLHHLQLLSWPFWRINSLPRSLKNLSNLRYLKAASLSKAFPTLPDIGKLTSLQGLKYFEVKKEKGCDIGQLKNLNELRGSLSISHLENVEGKDQAIQASLKDKKHLDELWLRWSDSHEIDRNINLDKEVVEGLQPPPNLTKLHIVGCKTLGCPSWLICEGCLENLRSLRLENTSFADLPTISKLFPRCQELSIWNLPNLRTLPFLPQSLEKLVIGACPLLVFVSEEELQNSTEGKKFIMTIVQSYPFNVSGDNLAEEYLHVRKLMESEKIDIPEDFQTFATNLQTEEMTTQVDDLNLREAYRRCQEQRLAAIFARKNKSELFLPSALQELVIGSTNITDGALSLCLGGLTSLKSLKLDEIKTITIVPTNHLVSLCVLAIEHCHYLNSLGALHALLSLKTLSIDYCPFLELEMMESDGRISLPHSLQSLMIGNSAHTERFAIGDLPNLNYVELKYLPLLESLSLSGLTALRNLHIRDCPELSRLDCAKFSPNSYLKIGNCPKLAEASFHFSSFDYLEIDSDATLGVLLSGSSECLAALKRLELSSCTEASFQEEHFNCLTSLKELSLHNCKVQSLPRSLKNLSSLESLWLNNCPHISSLSSNLPESLKTLSLRECKDISSLSDLPNSLHKLYLKNCPGISSLPMCLPKSLREIEISGCPVLKKRCRENKGEDWPKIAHIPFRDIQ